MFKKMVSVMLAGAMVISLAACGGGGSGADSGSGSQSETSGESSDEGSDEGGSGEAGGTISLWTWSPVTRTAEKMIAAFENENSDIKIDYTNYNYNPEY